MQDASIFLGTLILLAGPAQSFGAEIQCPTANPDELVCAGVLARQKTAILEQYILHTAHFCSFFVVRCSFYVGLVKSEPIL